MKDKLKKFFVKAKKILNWFMPKWPEDIENIECKNEFIEMIYSFIESFRFSFSAPVIFIGSCLAIPIAFFTDGLIAAIYAFLIASGVAAYIVLKNGDFEFKKKIEINKLLNYIKVGSLVIASTVLALTPNKNNKITTENKENIIAIDEQENIKTPNIDDKIEIPSKNEDNTIITEPIVDNPILKSNEEIAIEVIRGIWHDGEERKYLLTEAGYNWKEIQRIVNDIKYGRITIEEIESRISNYQRVLKP